MTVVIFGVNSANINQALHKSLTEDNLGGNLGMFGQKI